MLFFLLVNLFYLQKIAYTLTYFRKVLLKKWVRYLKDRHLQTPLAVSTPLSRTDKEIRDICKNKPILTENNYSDNSDSLGACDNDPQILDTNFNNKTIRPIINPPLSNALTNNTQNSLLNKNITLQQPELSETKISDTLNLPSPSSLPYDSQHYGCASIISGTSKNNCPNETNDISFQNLTLILYWR